MELDLRLSRKDEAAVLNFFQDAFSKGVKVPDSLSGLWNDLSYESHVRQEEQESKKLYPGDWEEVAKVKFKHESESFPILYENGRIQVYKNPSDEIFVENRRSRAVIRISLYGDGLSVTASECVVDSPTSFVVRGRK